MFLGMQGGPLGLFMKRVDMRTGGGAEGVQKQSSIRTSEQKYYFPLSPQNPVLSLSDMSLNLLTWERLIILYISEGQRENERTVEKNQA